MTDQRPRSAVTASPGPRDAETPAELLEQAAAALEDPTRAEQEPMAAALEDPTRAEQEAMAAALEDPTRAEQEAMAAFARLSHAEADAGGRNFDLLLRAAWVILRSRCVTGRLSAAEDAYQMALPFLGAAPPISGGRAMLLAGVARLRWTQGRLDEARALFAHAAALFGEALERHGQAACRALGGFLWAELADARIDLDLAPALAVRVLLLHAWCHLGTGRMEQGRDSLRAARELYDRAPSAGEDTFRAWWEARIASLEGQPDRAQEQLDAVRRR
ncbi:MAG TPA: hypothetical protein VJA16_23965, partial [Thermoanaerobaculia bacterium]